MTKKKVRRDKLASSPAVLAASATRRLVKQVVVTGVTMAKTVTVIPPSQFKKLGVDERYQRVRVDDEINDLIHIIKAGGQVPDPVHIAQRTDSSLWIVDGQQRFWAHWECEEPLRAFIHGVENIDAETNLFYALNTRHRLSARTVAKGWPGISGDLLRKMNTDAASPLLGLIDMQNSTTYPVDATTLIKGFLTLTTGLMPNGNMMTRVLPRLDTALKVPGMIAWCEQFSQLLAAVFDMRKGVGRVRILPMLALASVAHKKYVAAGRPVFPTTCAYMRRTNWDSIAPSHAQQFLPLLVSAIEKKWR
jgi:hypothetical protein